MDASLAVVKPRRSMPPALAPALPRHWRDRTQADNKRAQPINARPDLAKRIYRFPLRVGRLTKDLSSISRQTRIERAALSSRMNTASAFDISKFQPIKLRPGQKLRPEVVVAAMRPGFPHGLSGNDVLGRTRVSAAALARQIAYYIMVHGFGISRALTGRRFGVDHTSVLHGIGKIRRLIDSGALDDPLPFVKPAPVSQQTTMEDAA